MADGDPGNAAGSLWSKLGWFVLLWLGGVATVGLVAFAIRAAVA